jgi:hypothetical protein
MFIAGKHAARLAVILVKGGDHAKEGIAVERGARVSIPYDWLLEAHGDVDAVCPHAWVGRFVRVAEVGKMGAPIEPLALKLAR